jgi:D-alanine--poly(phosphoribitol) ligase subunit 2
MGAVDRASVQRALNDHIVSEILLRKTPLGADEDLFAAGFDSMSLSRLLVFVEERFGVMIPDQDVVIDELSTLEKVTSFVLERIEKTQAT